MQKSTDLLDYASKAHFLQACVENGVPVPGIITEQEIAVSVQFYLLDLNLKRCLSFRFESLPIIRNPLLQHF